MLSKLLLLLHHDKTRRIADRHGCVPIRILRRIYGMSFADGYSDRERLADALNHLDDASLLALLRDEELDRLDGKIAHRRFR